MKIYSSVLNGIRVLIGIISVAMVFSACARNKDITAMNFVINPLPTDSLSPEMKFKYNSYFLEAIREKQRKNTAAEYELINKALEICPNAPEALFEKSQIVLTQDGGLDKSTQLLKRAIALAPWELDYQHLLATVYSMHNDYKEAIDVYEKMADHGEKTEDVYSRLVQLYEQQQDYQNVIKSLNNLESIAGKTEAITMKKYAIFQQLNDSANAMREIQELCDEYPGDLRYRVVLGDYWQLHGNRQKALEILQDVILRDSLNLYAQASLLDLYRDAHNDSMIVKQINEIFSNPNASGQVLAQVMTIWITARKAQKVDSLTFYDGVIKAINLPQENYDFVESVEQYLTKDNWTIDKIIPVGRRMLEIAPDYDDARVRQIYRFILKEQNDSVAKLCSEGKNLNPRNIFYYYYLGLYNLVNHNDNKCLQIWQEGVERCDTTLYTSLISETYGAIGDILVERKDKQAAYVSYDQSLMYNSENVVVLNNYAYFLCLDNARLDDAEAMSERAVKAEPENPTYLDTYAWIFFVKKQYDKARKYIDSAMNYIEEKPMYADYYAHAGDIYYMNGLKSKALTFWQKAFYLTDKTEQKVLLKKKIKLRKYIAL